ncbi:PBECR4 domain-containing protein [Ligilactobacillus saerimneri]|uniref:PBECR4 domain-containing protein n=1 Tax=Ligilactobacillus saerimneri TaxID=228229 RepID=UPI0030D43DEF
MVKAIDYYGVPTEIFARAFELYVKNQGFDTSLLAPDERFKGAEYAIFDEDLQDKINTFFQGEFPELAGKIREFQKEQAENQQEVQASEKQIESKEQEKEEGIAVQEELSLDNETEQQDSSPKEANRKSEKQNEMPVEDEGTQKEGSKYAPSSQSETAGSGLPDQENLAHEFADPSFLHFTVTNERTQRIPTNYHAITEHELHGLNGVANELLDTARFYNDTLSSGIVNYIYVEDQQVKTLRVRFGKENFAHLTGLIFEGKSPKELLNDLVKSNGAQKNIFVKNDGTTFEKLGVIGGIKQLANTNAMELNKFDDIGQARRLNFTEAIKVTDENLLLALRNTDLDVFSPVSLLNLDNKNKVSSQYLRVPENEIVAIVAERNAQGLPMMVPLDMNDKYINPSEAFVISNALSNYAYEHREEIQDQEAQVTPTEVIDGLVDEGKITPIIEQQAEEPEPSPVVKEEPEVSAENNNSTKVDQEDEQVVEASATNVEGEETIESNEMPPLGVNQPEQQETVENEQTELVAEEPATQEETQSANKNDSANEGEKQQGKEESRDLRRARKKLERLETALRVTVEELEKQRTQTADQSQNTKRLEKLENDVADINKEIQAQNKRIKKLEREAENQAKGLNKDGKGLEISVQNLPRIEAEIEKANNGESKYAKREITWYRKMVSELKKAKEISEEPLMPGAHVDDGLLNQWSKWPNTYYVKGLRGVALEQTADGEFVVSPRSKIKNGEQQRRVDELLQMQYEINEQITEQNEQSQAESTSDTDNEQVKEEQTARENAEIGAGAVVGYAANEELQNYLVNNLNYAPETVDFFVEQGVLQNGLVQGQPAANQGVVTFGEPKRLVAFESASDMMAYYEIQNARGNLRDVSLVNLNDLSEKELAKVYGTIRKDDPSFAKFTERSTNDVDQFVDHYFIYTGQGEVTLAVRNNDRGLEFYQRLHENYPKLGLDLDMPPKGLGQRSMSWWKYLHELKSNGLSLTQDLPGTRISLVQENRKQEIIDTINGFIEKNNAPEIVNTFAVDGNEKKISPLFKDVETALYKPADSFNENRENSVTQTPSATQETVRQEQVQETDRATTAERTAPTQNKPKVSPVQLVFRQESPDSQSGEECPSNSAFGAAFSFRIFSLGAVQRYS